MGLGSSFGMSAETSNNIQTKGLDFYADFAYKATNSRAGSTAHDLAGSNDLTLQSTTLDANDYVSYDGNDDYMTTNFDPPSGNSTYTAWAYWQDTADPWQAIFNSASSTLYLWFGRSGDGQLYLHHHNNNNTNHRTFTGNSTLAEDEWIHIASTWDGSAIKLYINGVLTSSTTQGTPANITSADGIWIGRYNNDYHGGRIGQLCVYSRALTAGQILQNYNASKERFGL